MNVDLDDVAELGAFTIDVDDAEFTALLGPQPGPAGLVACLGPSAELTAVTNRISSQYVEIVRLAAAGVFSGGDTRSSLHQLASALDALEKLARVAQEPEPVALIDELRPTLLACAANPRGRDRDRFLARLRTWLPRFAEGLGEPGDSLRELVSYDTASIPLFEDLLGLRGIGPRRLDRLFCAGLYAVEVVSGADPVEVAQVTGLPRGLAEEVVARARGFAEDRRRRCLTELRARLAEFQDVVRTLDPGSAPELHALAQAAVREMQGMVTMYPPRGTS